MPTKVSPYGPIKFTSIDDYHASFTPDVQEKLEQLRQAIKDAAPQAIETISYNMPTFKQHQNLAHYAAYKKHIGFYPTPVPIEFYKQELQEYVTSKGAIQFPLDKPLPLDLIKKMVEHSLKLATTKKDEK